MLGYKACRPSAAYRKEFNSLHSGVGILVPLLRSDYANRRKYLIELELEGTSDLASTQHKKSLQARIMAGTKFLLVIGALLGEPCSFMGEVKHMGGLYRVFKQPFVESSTLPYLRI